MTEAIRNYYDCFRPLAYLDGQCSEGLLRVRFGLEAVVEDCTVNSPFVRIADLGA